MDSGDIELPIDIDLTDNVAVYNWVIETALEHRGEAGTRKKLSIMTMRSEDTIRSWVSGRRSPIKKNQDKIPPKLAEGKPRITWEDIPDILLSMAHTHRVVIAYQIKSLKRIDEAAEAARHEARTTTDFAVMNKKVREWGAWEQQLGRITAALGQNTTGFIRAFNPIGEGQDTSASSELVKELAQYEKGLSDEPTIN